MEPKFKKIKDRKGNINIYGVYRPDGQVYGKDGILKKLCSEEDADYKNTKHGRKKRTDREVLNFVNSLFYERATEIKQEKYTRPGMRFKEAGQMFIEEKTIDGELDLYTLKAYMRTFTFYVETVGNHPVNQFKNEYTAKIRGGLKKKITYWKGIETRPVKQSLSPMTVNTYITRINAFYKWAWKEKLTPEQFNIKRVRTVTRKKTAYSPEHQERIEALLFKLLTESMPHHRQGYLNMYRIYMVISATGMRLAEVWSLKLKRIDIARGVLEVRGVPEIGYKIKEGAEKNVTISDYLAAFLKHDLAGRDPTEKWYIDTGYGGIHYKRPDIISSGFRQLLIRHGLYSPEIKPWHGFRASVATRLIEAKGIMHAKTLLGHHDISTTEMYADIEMLDMREAVNQLRIRSKFDVPRLPEQIVE